MESDQPSWRNRAAFALAVLVWLAAWYLGRTIGLRLVPGSFTYTVVGGVIGWCVGLGLAALILLIDETLP